MAFFHDSHKQLIIDLLDAGVEFMLVGGYAVNLHGYVRATQDMDIWLKPDNVNKLKLTGVLKKRGYDEEGISFIERQNFEKTFAFHIGERPMTVDFITRVSGIEYSDADAQKVMLPLGDATVPVIHLHHLVLSKTGTGRLQDAADIENLQKIAEKRKKD